ncbi:hypothetical protein [Flavobacterium sp. GT3R68]|uniref:hypothetical protein n=1 Tax=Flavobacterium sp. GT3R68 TaxID=2594437 RepID=UPI000F8613D1|nr:hypothetical protein [Flavobacterium sp. GT3R68]RTY90886.1 hypothetical protein EKL32_19690 [Flavobacterium sp. GSN2]TRW90449.1 hypothetical protein FNW07_10470 [Flavobacterium sp. GT3R68]
MKKISITFLMFFLISPIWAQETHRPALHGKITAATSDVEGIYVINMKTEKAVITTTGGYFTIPAAEGDTLMFSAVQFKGKRVVVSKDGLNNNLMFVYMELMVNQLREVVVNEYAHINAAALGIIPKDQKSYTPAERKLKAANGLALAGNGDGTTGGSFSADPLLNIFSGRTAMLKKELEVEKKEFWLQKLDQMFEVSHFVETLKIPSDYVKGFEYYIVENNTFVESLKSKNKIMATFLMGELAVKYNEMIACEEE